MPQQSNRKIVVVLGMHRSGTSLLTNLLSGLGVDLGENLLAADASNQAGYWEQEEIYKTQDRMLGALGRHWLNVGGTFPFPDQWWLKPEVLPFKQRLIDIVQSELAKSKGLWGFKDPRTSRLLPLWKEIFAELQVEPLYLLSVREPGAVAESMVKRDKLPASRIELMWLLHNLDAIRDTGDRLRLIVDYDRWFSQPREQAEAVAQAIGISPASNSDVLKTLTSRIRSDLRHCRTQSQYALPFIADTYNLLKHGADTGTIPAELSAISAGVERAFDLCAPWISSATNPTAVSAPSPAPAASFTTPAQKRADSVRASQLFQSITAPAKLKPETAVSDELGNKLAQAQQALVNGHLTLARLLCEEVLEIQPSHKEAKTCLLAIENAPKNLTPQSPPSEVTSNSPSVSQAPVRKKILFVSHEASRSGAPTFLLHLLHWVKANTDFEIMVLLGRGGPLEAQFRELGETFTPETFGKDPQRLVGVELIYSNTCTNAALLDSIPRGTIPVITHIHELEYVIGWFGNFAPAKSQTNHFIACSEAVASNLRERHGIQAERVSVHYEAINASATQKRAAEVSPAQVRELLGIPQNAFVITACGTAEWRKGPDLFLQAASRIRSQAASVQPVYFLWIGFIPEDERGQILRHDVERLGLSSVFRFVGEQENPYPTLNASDLFCLTSREDPFPLVMLEAGALGKPLVCFENSGGAPEFCKTGAGVTVPYLDVEAFATQCLRLMNDGSVREQMGEAASRVVRDTFDVTKVIPELWNDVTGIVSTHNKAVTIPPAPTDYDILIPIYNAPDDVARCVESLLRHTEPRHTIYLLDDASPDARIAPLLRNFASRHAHIKIVPAEKNGGFVLNMNRGFALSRRDVIILNSDTEVTPRWLDRMDRCRRSDSAIGIVCPLSNNATILSVPTMNARNTLPADMPPDRFAQIVAAKSERLYPRIPTAIGFCMLITRETLDAVGYFDPAFGLGYGEENDLCLRAWAAGKQSVCCDDAYVQHYGEASFSQVEGIGERRRRNAQLLDRRWPGYSTSIYRYCQSNPLRKLQEQLRTAISKEQTRRPHVLQVIHNYNAPGGTELHTQDIVERVSDRFRQTVVFPGTISNWSDYSEAPSNSATRITVLNRLNTDPTHRFLGQPGDIRNTAVEDNFRKFLAGGDYDVVHFQHLVGWASLRLPRIAREMGKRCILSVHDYFLLCPEYVLINSDGQRCEKVRASATDKDCLRCLTAKRANTRTDAPATADYLQMRETLSAEVLEAMDVAVVPSEFVRRRILNAFGERFAERIRVIPHGVNVPARVERPARKPNGQFRVGILGSLGPQKGLKQVIEAAGLLKDTSVRLELFGHVAPGARKTLESLSVKLHGGYQRENLPELLREVDLILIPSLFDETFCLTLSEAQALGVPVLASAVGAIPERIEDGKNGFLFSPATGNAMAARLKEISRDPDLVQAVGKRVKELTVKTMDQNAEDYARLYQQVLKSPTRPNTFASEAAPATTQSGVWRNTLTQQADKGGLTSIIILTWNQLEHTKRCVESIASHTPEPHEIIFVDNGSTDETVAWLRDYAKANAHVRVIENRSNRGFAGGNNQGLSIAKGEFLLLLNNDTIVTPGWLGRLLRAAKVHPKIGMVGPMSNCVSGPQLVSGVPYRNIDMLAAFSTIWAVEQADQIQSCVRLVGFCLLMRRAVLDAIGGLDESYGSGNFEDDDLSIRARLAGFETVIARSAFVHHVGSQTFKGQQINYNAAMLRNWDLFRTKWQLPKEASLQHGYPIPKTLPKGVTLKIPLPSVALSHKASDECWWSEAQVKTESTSGVPPIAKLGNLREAREQFGRKEFAEAWENTITAVCKRPFHPEAFLLLAEIALAAGDANSARACAQRARDLAPGWKAPKQFLQKPLKGNTKPEWLVLPESIANRQSAIGNLSVCVITKNEEKFIEQCLKSVQGLATQIVVVDTGSTDKTVEIAKSLGAEIHTFTWCDDFSAARNAALEHATGDWVLMLDADEELPADQHANLKKDISKVEALAYRLPLVNIGQNDGRSFVPRLFRNAPGVYFYGRIHEQVFPSLIPFCKPWGMKTDLGTAQLTHHGYTKEMVKDRNKVERNLRLLRQAVEERPTDVNLVMNFGLELVRSGELTQGLDKYREAFRLMSAQPTEEVVPELREVLLTQFTSHLYKVREHSEVVQTLTSPLAKNGGLTASLHFALGLAQFELKQYAEAAEQMRQCIAKCNQPALSPINTDILTAAPSHCLALSLMHLGEFAAAENAFEAALKEKGALENVKLDYARLLVRQNRAIDALHKLHEVVAENPNSANAWKLGAEIALQSPDFLEFACDWTGEAVRALPEDKALIACRAEALLLSQQTKDAHPLWERAVNCARPPHALAALILCSAVESQPIPPTRDPAEETATSQAFVSWYQKLISARAEQTIMRVNSRVDALRGSLPTAANLLDSALAAAKQ